MEAGGCVCGASAAPGTGRARGNRVLISGCREVTPSRRPSEAIRRIGENGPEDDGAEIVDASGISDPFRTVGDRVGPYERFGRERAAGRRAAPGPPARERWITPRSREPGETRAMSTADLPDGTAPGGPGRGRQRFRRIVAGTLIVVASVSAPFAFVAFWTHRTIYTETGYVDAVTPLARQKSIQDAIATRVTTLLESYLRSADVASKLPGRLQPATSAGRRALDALVGKETVAAVQSKAFQELWRRANRAIHQQVVKWITNSGTDLRFRIQGDKVQIDLTPLVQQVQTRLAKSGIPLISGVSLEGLHPQYTIFQGSVATSVQRGLRALDTLAYAVPLFVLAAYAAAVAVAVRRRRALLQAGVGFAIGTAAGLLGLWIGHGFYLDVVRGAGMSTTAASDAYRILLRGLRTQLWIGLAIGVLVAVGAWLFGSSRPATRVRALATGSGRASSGVASRPRGSTTPATPGHPG
jgi:hypothetical protein